MKVRRFSVAIILSSLMLTGCDFDLGALSRVGQLEDRIAAQEQQIKNVVASNQQLKKDLDALRAKVINQELNALLDDVPDYEELSLTEQNYSVVETNLGALLLLVENITPYAGGSKVTLSIGNINAVTYPGVKIDAIWANAHPKAQEFQSDSQKSKSFDLLGDLASGAWSTKDIVLPGTKPDDLGYLSVHASVSQVKLRAPAKR